jgi:ethanolamine utilization protein EutM
MQKAIGLVETRGIVVMMEAADVMLKAADVRLISQERIGSGFLTVIVTGDVADVEIAVQAGAEAAKRIGLVYSTHVIARPHDELDKILFK